ncbi:MAG: 16S rRNA (guanine(527)-N(7))-methyltransferase RsmG [Gammaproteobacteria bacterium]
MAILTPPAGSPEEQLRKHLPELGLGADARLVDALAAYLRLLDKWNQAFNLTSIRDQGEMVVRHVLDSLSARPFLQGGRVLDVGCGAGLPGIPLALADPGRSYTLLDSGLKKIRFVRQAIAELKISNADAVQMRVEDYAPMQLFDTVTSRAFAALPDFVAGAGRLVAPGGRLLAMKGRLPADELAALPEGWVAGAVTPVRVPALDAERHMIVVSRGAGDTGRAA